MNVEYHILSENMADIFAKINITPFVLSLSEENCEVLSMTERDESLESYYVNLVGGVSYE